HHPKTIDSNAPKTNDSNPESDQKKLSGVGIILDYPILWNYPGINSITFSKVLKVHGYYGF
ncbi:23958_t:CDS:1, partial [Gigaspora margarita]